MIKKKWYVLLVLLLTSALLLVACGGAEEEPGAVEPTEAPVEEPMEEPTEEPMEEPTEEPVEEPEEEEVEEPEEEEAVEPEEEEAEEPEEEPTAVPVLSECEPGDETLAIWADETRSQLMVDLAGPFREEYGVCLEISQLGFGDIRDRVKIVAPAGEGPDLFVGAHDWLGELVINGLLATVDLGEKEGDFLEVALEGCSYDGELYCMPYAIENVAFIYNPELVPEAPETWDEVREIAIELEEAGEVENGYIIQQNDPYHFFPIMTAFGGYVFGLTDTGYDPTDVGIDSEGSIAAAQWVDEMAEEGHIPPGVDYDVMHEQFESGNAAMMITGPWALSRIRESGVPYAVANIPAGTEEARPFVGVQGFMINAFSEQQLLANIFLTEFVATENVMQQLFETGDRPVAYEPVFNAIDDPDIAAFAAAGENGLPMPAIPEMSAVWSSWGDAQQLVITQESEPEDAFGNAAEQIRSAIEEASGN
ncbi:MAG TPA: maltose ABC transporter substrate-binding protein [Candidatus Sulfomarinibacteraceae bacterium]|nr:maltose ABC transporter substrate-binding protein [Candidatus Sulfomarinibacteraceae bacterium]